MGGAAPEVRLVELLVLPSGSRGNGGGGADEADRSPPRFVWWLILGIIFLHDHPDPRVQDGESRLGEALEQCVC